MQINYYQNAVDNDIFHDNEEIFNKNQLFLLKQVEEQRHAMIINHGLNNKYSNLAIMFGYIAMFSPAFPWTTLLGMAFYGIKLLFGTHGLSKRFKRLQAQEIGSLGIWNQIFEYLAFASLVVNCLFIFITSDEISELGGYDYISEYYEKKFIDLAIIIAGEHIIFMIKFALNVLIPDQPRWVRESIRARSYHETPAIEARFATNTSKFLVIHQQSESSQKRLEDAANPEQRFIVSKGKKLPPIQKNVETSKSAEIDINISPPIKSMFMHIRKRTNNVIET